MFLIFNVFNNIFEGAVNVINSAYCGILYMLEKNNHSFEQIFY